MEKYENTHVPEELMRYVQDRAGDQGRLLDVNLLSHDLEGILGWIEERLPKPRDEEDSRDCGWNAALSAVQEIFHSREIDLVKRSFEHWNMCVFPETRTKLSGRTYTSPTECGGGNP